jgi:hypothetical protein
MSEREIELERRFPQRWAKDGAEIEKPHPLVLANNDLFAQNVPDSHTSDSGFLSRLSGSLSRFGQKEVIAICFASVRRIHG